VQRLGDLGDLGDSGDSHAFFQRLLRIPQQLREVRQTERALQLPQAQEVQQTERALQLPQAQEVQQTERALQLTREELQQKERVLQLTRVERPPEQFLYLQQYAPRRQTHQMPPLESIQQAHSHFAPSFAVEDGYIH
jgi:hypothetical protein